MSNQWTAEQQQAISKRNCDLLVSAAAGSGKTAVLVERIITRITKDTPPIDIDQMLIVTFTKAAALEMSQRIGKVLLQQLQEDPQNFHLQNQLTLLQKADIKTIHAFCLQLIKEYYYVLDLDPAFRTGDSGEMKLLKQEVLDQYFEELYKKGETRFFSLVETFGEDTKDVGLKELVKKIERFAQGFPNPKEALQSMLLPYQLEDDTMLDDTYWLPLIREAIFERMAYAEEMLDFAMTLASGSAGFDGYLNCLQTEIEAVEALKETLSSISYKKWHMAYIQIVFERLPAYRGEEKDLADIIKTYRTKAKDTIGKLKEDFFCYGEEMHRDLIVSLYPVAETLVEVVCGFMDAFALEKKERRVIDFSDYEHFALQILVDPKSTIHDIYPTKIAEEVQARYTEIMIDEYQDSNIVQEMILYAVSGASKNRHNRFMVGDVKQSIYRFRLAMPELFNEKYKTYPLDGEGSTCKIVLSKNFRSRHHVLEGINFIFKQCMTADFGDVIYDDSVALHTGAMFKEPSPQENIATENELILLETKDGVTTEGEEDVVAELKRQELELIAVAKKIKEMMDADLMIYDGKLQNYRKLKFGDIALLLRSPKNFVAIMEEVFTREGIPYYAETSVGYYDVAEVELVLHFLRIIDNPRQDIPLIAVLHSPMYRFTTDELLEIRMHLKEGLFYEALCAYDVAEDGISLELQKKIGAFFADFTFYRQKNLELSLYELLHLFYARSGYYDYLGTKPLGNLSQGNLKLLLEKAIAYESGIHTGLFFFIRYVENLKLIEDDSPTAKDDGSVDEFVQVMTIHKSKGLEFPVVFLCDMGKNINMQDTMAQCITHQTWGFSFDYTDLQRRAVYKTLCKKALGEVAKRDTLSEELRVLYVALTRAKEKLILVGHTKDLEKSLENWGRVANETKPQFSLSQLRRGKTYLDFVVPSLLRHPNLGEKNKAFSAYGNAKAFKETLLPWLITMYHKADILQYLDCEEQILEEKQSLFTHWDTDKQYVSEKMKMSIEENFLYRYPNEKATQLQGKISISEMKRKFIEQTTGEYFFSTPKQLEFPEIKNQKKLTAAQLGTITHRVMELLDFSISYTRDVLEEVLVQFVADGKLLQEEKNAVNHKAILQFFESELGQRLQQSKQVEKEKPFAMLLSAKEALFDETYRDVTDEIVVNGIIDCYFYDHAKDEERLILVDYKSDGLTKDEDFLSRYKIQLDIYKKALENGLEKKVDEMYIYSFSLGRAILCEW